MEVDELVFKREDCIVERAMVDSGETGKQFPRWGTYAGNTIDGVTGPAIKNKINAITVLHIPSGISATVDTFHPNRNKELAFLKVEELVNRAIEQMKNPHG